jgi:hypothetical protein
MGAEGLDYEGVGGTLWGAGSAPSDAFWLSAGVSAALPCLLITFARSSSSLLNVTEPFQLSGI